MTALLVATALGCLLVAGGLWVFSSFVMASLARLDDRYGIEAMQHINTLILRTGFLGAFFATGLLCLAASGMAFAGLLPGSPTWITTGSALYLIGCIGVTGACNVPRNERLAAVDPTSPEAAAVWHDYLRTWTRWNSLRVILATAAGLVFLLQAIAAGNVSS